MKLKLDKRGRENIKGIEISQRRDDQYIRDLTGVK